MEVANPNSIDLFIGHTTSCLWIVVRDALDNHDKEKLN